MSSKDKNLTPVQQEYKKFEQQREPKRPVLKNCIKAFFVGGFICLIGQLISTFYITYFDFTERSAGNPTVATLIFISMLLTGFGVYDRLGQLLVLVPQFPSLDLVILLLPHVLNTVQKDSFSALVVTCLN